MLLIYLGFFCLFHKLVKYIRKALKFFSKFKKLKKFDKNFFKGHTYKETEGEVSADDMHVDENLDKYWECLPGQEQKRWFTKEAHLRN